VACYIDSGARGVVLDLDSSIVKAEIENWSVFLFMCVFVFLFVFLCFYVCFYVCFYLCGHTRNLLSGHARDLLCSHTRGLLCGICIVHIF